MTTTTKRRVQSVEERFWPKVREAAALDCWLWTATTADGYGQFYINRRGQGAHRVAYELLIGPIPDGLVLDHLCNNRLCVNPWHMEPVTNRENTRRGMRAFSVSITHCKAAGHLLSGPNAYIDPRGGRHCRACRRARRSDRFRLAKAGVPVSPTTLATAARQREVA